MGNSMIMKHAWFYIVLLLALCGKAADQPVLEDAVKKLLEGDETAIPVLLRDPQRAVAALSELRRGDDIPTLLQQLDADRHQDREAATLALIRYDEMAWPAVKVHMERHQDNPEVRLRCSRILAAKPEETVKMTVAAAKFLMEVDGLQAEQILPFAASYHAWLNAYEIPKDFDPVFIRFAAQYALLPNGMERLAAKVKGEDPYWLDKIIPIALNQSLDNSRYLLELPRFRATTFDELLGQYQDQMTDDRWKQVFDLVIRMPHDYQRVFSCKAAAFPGYFRQRAVQLLNAGHGQLQCLGLQLYPGDWREIREHVTRIYDPANGKIYFNFMDDIDVPKRDAPFVLQVILSKPMTHLRYNYFEPLADKVDPFPARELLAHISRPEDIAGREVWARVLLKHRPEMRAEVVRNMYALLGEEAIQISKRSILSILTEQCGQEIPTGKLDDTWLKLRPENAFELSEWQRYGPDLRVSHKLLLDEVKKMKQPDGTTDQLSFSGVRYKTLNYILAAPDKVTLDQGIDYILATLERSNHEEYNYVSILDRIIELRPEVAPFLLKCKSSYFSKSGNILYYCMTECDGSHGDSFHEVAGFIRKHREIILRQMQQVEPGQVLTWFPYVACLAMDTEAREKHQDLLRELMTASLPKLMNTPDALRCAVIAAKALEMAGDDVDRAVLQVIRKPPKHYVEEMCWVLEDKNKGIVPDLLPLIETGNIHAMYAAVASAPDSKEVLAALRNGYFNSDNHQVAMICAEGMGIDGRLPPLAELPTARLDWLLSKADSRKESCDSLLNAVTNSDDVAVIARRLATRLPRVAEATHVGSELDLSRLIWQKPKAQKEVAGTLVAMLESQTQSHREYAAAELGSCPEGAATYVDRIRTCLAREQNQRVRRSLLWAVANIGPPAQAMEDTVRPLAGKEEEYALFCLANIAAAPKDRESWLKKLMAIAEKHPDTNHVRMMGLVQGQEEIVRPFLIRMLLNGRRTLVGPKPEQQWVHRDAAIEAMYSLARRPPRADIHDAFKEFLKDLVAERYDINQHMASALFWSLRTYAKDDLKEFAPLLGSVPFHYQLSKSNWLIERAMKKQSLND